MKCCRKVYLDWGTGWEDVSHLVKYETLNITKRAASNTYHKAQNYINFTLTYDEDVFQSIYDATESIKVKVEAQTTENLFPSDTLYPDDILFPMDENATRVLFTGIIPPTASRTYNGILDNTMLDMEGVDSQDLLDVEVGDWYLENCTIMNPANKAKSIIHQLAYIAGFTDAQIDQTITISKAFTAFSPNSEKDKILTIMDILLFEHGYVFNMNAEDQISPVQWIGIPSIIYTFGEAQIVKEIKVKEKERTYNAIELTWYELNTMENVRIYTESLPYASNGQFAGYPVPSTYYYPVEANVTDRTTGSLTEVYQEYTDAGIEYKTNEAILNSLDYNYKAFDSDFSGIIITKDHELFDDREGLTLVASEFGNKKARILYQNNGAVARRLYYMYINATVTYKSSERKLVAGIDTDSEMTDKYESYFIYDAESADILAQNMVQMYGAGNTQYEFESTIEVPEGSFVNLFTNDATDLVCFVAEKQYDERTGLFSYVLVGYTENEGVIISEEVSSVNGTYAAFASALANDAYNQAIQALADASTAQSTADGKIESFFQTTEPVTASEGDIWFDTDDGNKVYVYSTISGWQNAQDSEIAEAISLAVTASGIADGKSTTYYQASAPVGLDASDQGDLWVDTDANYKTYAWNGSSWVLAQDWYTANQNAITASGLAVAAQATADSKITLSQVPEYRGRYLNSTPSSGNTSGDTCLVYSSTSSARGIYLYTTSWAKQTTPTMEMISNAWVDICAVTTAGVVTGAPYGEVTDYIGSQVNFIEALVANQAFINELRTKTIQFTESVSAIDYQSGTTPTRGDEQIYVGKQPRLVPVADTENDFRIQSYVGTYGAYEVWSILFGTRADTNGSKELFTQGTISAQRSVKSNLGRVIEWTNMAQGVSSTGGNVYSTVRCGNALICAGNWGLVYRSTDDGETWTQISSGVSYDLYSAASNGSNVVVIVGKGGILYSSNSGASFTSVQTLTDNSNVYAHDVHYDGTRFIAIVNGVSTGYMYTSTSGSTWSSMIPPTTGVLYCIHSGNGYWVMGTSTGLWRSSSSSYATWTNSGAYYFREIKYGNSIFVGRDNSLNVLYFTDPSNLAGTINITGNTSGEVPTGIEVVEDGVYFSTATGKIYFVAMSGFFNASVKIYDDSSYTQMRLYYDTTSKSLFAMSRHANGYGKIGKSVFLEAGAGIVEKGSSSDGRSEYTLFSDGTLICRGKWPNGTAHGTFISFPYVYRSASNLSINLTPDRNLSSSYDYIAPFDTTVSGFKINGRDSSGNPSAMGFMYVAIGRAAT